MRQGTAGIGIYAREDIPAGTLVERCPVFVICTNAGSVRHGLAHNTVDMTNYTSDKAILSVVTEPYAPGPLDQRDSPQSMAKLTLMAHMVIPWRRDPVKCLALGYGMLYNHSEENWNTIALAYVCPKTQRRFLDFTAWRDIHKGDEFLMNYGDQLWFEPRKEEPLERPLRDASSIAKLVTIMDEHEAGCVAMGEAPANPSTLPDEELLLSAQKWMQLQEEMQQREEEDE